MSGILRTVAIPFNPDTLSEMAHVFYLAKLRVERGEKRDIGTALCEVTSDIAALKAGRPASGKFMAGIGAQGHRLVWEEVRV